MSDAGMQVLEGVELVGGRVNVDDAQILENIRSAIRRGHPQVKPQHVQADPVALVCGGPSLESTVDELREAVAAGAKIVTVNGAYRWCIERNFVPSMQIVMDARSSNARFFDPPLPKCYYALASQCHPSAWDAVEGREHVWIYHVGVSEKESAAHQLLDSYYLRSWHGISGGTTVGTRAIALLRTIGYVRFDIFGMDSCWLESQHHAYQQPENERDQRLTFTAHPSGHPELARRFVCAPWHVQQVADLLQFVRFQGQHFVLNVHGDGLIAYVLQSSAEVVMKEESSGLA